MHLTVELPLLPTRALYKRQFRVDPELYARIKAVSVARNVSLGALLRTTTGLDAQCTHKQMVERLQFLFAPDPGT
jgi:hypothetical protein